MLNNNVDKYTCVLLVALLLPTFTCKSKKDTGNFHSTDLPAPTSTTLPTNLNAANNSTAKVSFDDSISVFMPSSFVDPDEWYSSILFYDDEYKRDFFRAFTSDTERIFRAVPPESTIDYRGQFVEVSNQNLTEKIFGIGGKWFSKKKAYYGLFEDSKTWEPIKLQCNLKMAAIGRCGGSAEELLLDLFVKAKNDSRLPKMIVGVPENYKTKPAEYVGFTLCEEKIVKNDTTNVIQSLVRRYAPTSPTKSIKHLLVTAKEQSSYMPLNMDIALVNNSDDTTFISDDFPFYSEPTDKDQFFVTDVDGNGVSELVFHCCTGSAWVICYFDGDGHFKFQSLVNPCRTGEKGGC